MRMDPTQSLGLRISASKSASRIEKRSTFDPQKLFGGFEQKRKKWIQGLSSGDSGSQMKTPSAPQFFVCLESTNYVGALVIICLSLFQLLLPREHGF